MEKRWLRDWSLQKKMTLLFAALVLLPCILFSFFLYHFLFQRQYTERTRQYEALLSITEQRIVQNFAQVESVLEVFSYASSVNRLLSGTPNKSSAVAELLFGVQEEINRSEVYLSPYRAEIMILASSPDILERDSVFVKQARYNNDETVVQLLESTQKTLWGEPKTNLSSDHLYSKFTDTVIPYYTKIYSGISKNIGLAQCSVRMESLFLPVRDLSDKGVVRVWFEDRCLLQTAQGSAVLAPSYGTGRLESGWVRISNDYDNHNYRITLDVPQSSLRLGWGGLLLTILTISALAYLLMLLITRMLVRSILGRLHFAVDAMASINSSERYHPLPEMGLDEVGSIILSFNRLLGQLDQQYEELLTQEKDKRRFQALALQFQMNPHFLFNSLHWLQLRLEECSGNEVLCESIANLGDVYRYNLSSRRSATLSEEFLHITSYTSYMQAMKENTILLSVQCPDQYNEAQIPRFTLQPIVENAIRHGIIKGQPLTIAIAVKAVEDGLSIAVSNDGERIDADHLSDLQAQLAGGSPPQAANGSIGLHNLMLRLRLLYGHEAVMQISSVPGATCVTIKIPLAADSETAMGEDT